MKHNKPVSEQELDWVEEHYPELVQQFGGQWIAVNDNQVVAHSERLVDMRETITSQNIDNPFFTKIPTQEENDSPLFV